MKCYKRTLMFWGVMQVPCPDCETVSEKIMEQDNLCENCEKYRNL